jgi:hypothetical protein
LLHQLSEDQSNAHAFDMGQFFNRQNRGFKLKSIDYDLGLSGVLSPIATFEGSALAENDKIFGGESKSNEDYKEKDEFVAIAEGIDIPLYIFTYNIEMTQFVYTDLLTNPDQQEIIDKSIPARHHSQFISNQIADEGRLSNHNFTVSEAQYTKLIRHHKIATVEYQSNEAVPYPMPKGLEKHDVYIIE